MIKINLLPARPRRRFALAPPPRNQARPIYLMDALADTVPQDIWLTSVEEKEQVLKIAGSAFSTTAVADLMSNLKNSGKFRDVGLIVSRPDLAQTPRAGAL